MNPEDDDDGCRPGDGSGSSSFNFNPCPPGVTLEIIEWIEAILCREDGCIAREDVPLLMEVFGKEASIQLPEEMTQHLGDCLCDDCQESKNEFRQRT